MSCGMLIAAAICICILLSVPAAASEVMVSSYDGSGSAYFRSGPGKEYDILGYVYDGDILEITSQVSDGELIWGKTVYNGQSGWISMRQTVPYSDTVNQTEETAVDMDRMVQALDGSGYAYFRSGPGKSYSIICNVYDGTILHITSESSDGTYTWGKTVYNGTEGWISLRQTISYTASQASAEQQESTSGNESADASVQVEADEETDDETEDAKNSEEKTETVVSSSSASESESEVKSESDSESETDSTSGNTSIENGVVLTLNTDSESYSSSEQITASLVITNTNSFSVHDVYLEQIIPEGYVLAEGYSSLEKLDSIEAGEMYEFTVVFIQENSEESSVNLPVVFLVIALCFAVRCAFVFLLSKKKVNGKFLSVLLIITCSMGIFSGKTAEVYAKESAESSLYVQKVITVDGENLEIEGSAEFKI